MSTILQAYSVTRRPEKVLSILLDSIEHNKVRPFFNKHEAEQLFRRDVLLGYAEGRYSETGPISIADWADIIGNHAMPPLMNRSILDSTVVERDPDQKIVFAHQYLMSTRRLKVIEDWIFHSPQAQADIKKII